MQVHRADSIQHAAAMMATLGDGAKLLAGGTDLLIQLRRGALSCDHLIDIGRIAGLDGIAIDGNAVRIGALTLHRTIERYGAFAGPLRALIEAARVVGGWQVRNMATIGGNVANASPAADLIPVLLVLDATVELGGAGDTRHLPLSQFLLPWARSARRPSARRRRKPACKAMRSPTSCSRKPDAPLLPRAPRSTMCGPRAPIAVISLPG